MMRYQRVSPDSVPLGNGSKSIENGRLPNYNTTSTGTSAAFEGKSHSVRHNNNRSGSSTSSSPTNTQEPPNYFSPSSHFIASPPQNHSPSHKYTHHVSKGFGDLLLQWGQHKRSRGSRVMGEESSVVQSRQVIRIHRRVVEKQGIANHTMPPPPPPIASLLTRNIEEKASCPRNGSPSRNGGSNGSRAAVSQSTRSPETIAGYGDEKQVQQQQQVYHKSESTTTAVGRPSSSSMDQQVVGEKGGDEKASFETLEWPRIYISLSRKEKEDDFLAMKGTKLPQRPKKRAKNVEKTLQYCFPGMWLSDLTMGRYEVREKKSVKKQKKRGLKGMESMDSDSE